MIFSVIIAPIAEVLKIRQIFYNRFKNLFRLFMETPEAGYFTVALMVSLQP